MALAMMVRTRLWLPGAVSAQRDMALIRRLIERVHPCTAHRPLLFCTGAQAYPVVIVDALVVKVRRDEAVRATSALIVSGVNEQGLREVLGLWLGDSESEGTWADMFASLKRRGLRGVEVLVSDDHAGLVKAAQRYCQGVMWQRCQVHLGRNVLGRTPRHLRAQMAAGLRRLFPADERPTARAA